MKRFSCVMVVGFMVIVGCSGEAEKVEPVEETVIFAEWRSLEPDHMSEEQMVQHELCLAATNSMAAELMGELTAALEGEEPAQAVGVCREKAPYIASHIALDFGVKIGRTSQKLRNPANVPPSWALKVVAWGAGEPAYFAGPVGEFGALLPIRLKAECGMCHGPKEEIDEEIRLFIDEHYPEDKAIGFAEGDLRGWFWIEAPPAA